MKYHLMGLGGIGMSALARLLLQKGHVVQGSDVTRTELLEKLEKEGVRVFVGQTGEGIDSTDTVVYSSAVAQENVERQLALQKGCRFVHRSECLAEVVHGKKGLFVTGTHGKTTTSGLLSWVLWKGGYFPSFALGGILREVETNGHFGGGEYFVVEADESDGSFLAGRPFGAIVTNLEEEHLDYWKGKEALWQAFSTFCHKVQDPSYLFWCADDAALRSLSLPGESYGFSAEATARVVSYRREGRGMVATFSFEGVLYEDVHIALSGRHNVLNSLAVFALARRLQVQEGAIREALSTFPGTKRRLEVLGQGHYVDFFEDYGHHPTEIRVTLEALREEFVDRRLVLVFEPHRFSRVRQCKDLFAQAVDVADRVFLLDIYSAGEKGDRAKETQELLHHLQQRCGARVSYIPVEEIASFLRPFDVVVGMGAGAISRHIRQVREGVIAQKPRYKVAILCGGESVEREISILSANNLAAKLAEDRFEGKKVVLDAKGNWGNGPFSSDDLKWLQGVDVVLPAFHGERGEDGMFQGFLETLHIPYVGCDYRAAVACMHKGWTKDIAKKVGIPTASFMEMARCDYRKGVVFEEIEERIPYPLWVKPVHLGSSIGVSRVHAREELEKALALAFSLDDCVLLERHVEGRQIEFAVLGNEVLSTGAPCEICNHGAFYDFERKYGSNPIQTAIPAPITPLEERIGRELAERLFVALGCSGLARIDFFLDEKGCYWLNEVNPFPGFTHISGYPKMWEAMGLCQEALLDRLVILALSRHRKRGRCLA